MLRRAAILLGIGAALALGPAAAGQSAAPPLRFVAHPDPAVHYSARASGASIFVTDDEVMFSMACAGDRRLNLAIQLVGGAGVVRARTPLPGRVHMLKGDRRDADLTAYGEIVFEEIWPGIDAVFRGTTERLKYEFIVRPGARVENIRLRYRGADAISIEPDGRLRIDTAVGPLFDDAPVAFQDDREVDVRYVLDGDVGFAVEADAARPLVIDPGLTWSSFLGGAGDERGMAVAVDADGFVYVGGFSTAVNFPTTVGVVQEADGGGSQDGYVTKLAPDGASVVWSTYLGGADLDRVIGLDVDAAGNVYVTGETASPDFPVTTGAFDVTHEGYDAYAAKLDPSGSTLVYSTFLGGVKDDVGRSVRVDAAGRLHVAGWTKSADFPTTVGAFQTTFGGIFDAFALRLDPAGAALEYSTYLGGASTDLGLGIDIDAAGAAYVCGHAYSSGFPVTAGAFDETHNGSADVFVVKLSADGSAQEYSTFVGGSGTDSLFGHEIFIDDAGFAYVTGRTTSADFPVTPGAFDETYNGAGDAFVTVVDPAGAGLLYSTYLGGAGDEQGFAVKVDAAGVAFVTGSTTSADFPVTPDAFDASLDGGSDIFVSALSADGSGLESSTFLGGAGTEQARDLALGDGVTVVGYSDSADFPTTPGAFSTTINGPSDAVVARLEGGGDVTPPSLIVSVDPACLWPPNHKMQTVNVTVVATDDADPAPAFMLVSATSDEADEGFGDGDEPNDIQNAALGTADTSVDLRAERSALGDGRIYTLTYVAIDAAGNVSAPASVTVCVPKSPGGAVAGSGGGGSGCGLSAAGPSSTFPAALAGLLLLIPSIRARSTKPPRRPR